MATPYVIAANEIVDETIVSRSRFICYLYPCESLEQMKVFLKALQVLHPQANHHCYAYLAGRVEDSRYYGFSDDGEPSGTAGRPMLSALQGGNVGEVCAIVVRYFGGTKLGTGGLQRAYGASVRQALTLLGTKIKIPMVHKTLACQYSQVNDVLYLVEQIGGLVIEQDFTDTVRLTLAIPDEKLQAIEQQLQTFSSGQLLLKTLPNELA